MSQSKHTTDGDELGDFLRDTAPGGPYKKIVEDEYEDVCAECGGEIKNEGGISEELGIELIHYCTECGVTEGELVKKKVE